MQRTPDDVWHDLILRAAVFQDVANLKQHISHLNADILGDDPDSHKSLLQIAASMEGSGVHFCDADRRYHIVVSHADVIRVARRAMDLLRMNSRDGRITCVTETEDHAMLRNYFPSLFGPWVPADAIDASLPCATECSVQECKWIFPTPIESRMYRVSWLVEHAAEDLHPFNSWNAAFLFDTTVLGAILGAPPSFSLPSSASPDSLSLGLDSDSDGAFEDVDTPPPTRLFPDHPGGNCAPVNACCISEPRSIRVVACSAGPVLRGLAGLGLLLEVIDTESEVEEAVEQHFADDLSSCAASSAAPDAQLVAAITSFAAVIRLARHLRRDARTSDLISRYNNAIHVLRDEERASREAKRQTISAAHCLIPLCSMRFPRWLILSAALQFSRVMSPVQLWTFLESIAAREMPFLKDAPYRADVMLLFGHYPLPCINGRLVRCSSSFSAQPGSLDKASRQNAELVLMRQVMDNVLVQPVTTLLRLALTDWATLRKRIAFEHVFGQLPPLDYF